MTGAAVETIKGVVLMHMTLCFVVFMMLCALVALIVIVDRNANQTFGVDYSL